MNGWVVVEIARDGSELVCDEMWWDSALEANYEARMQERTARLCYPHLGYRYEVREAQS